VACRSQENITDRAAVDGRRVCANFCEQRTVAWSAQHVHTVVNFDFVNRSRLRKARAHKGLLCQ
jgi:hypothetical protein